MAKYELALAEAQVESIILTVRGQKVILDSDLAALYGVTTKRLNEQVKRNPDRFPLDFAFQLTPEEVANLRSQIVISSSQALATADVTILRSQSATSKPDGRKGIRSQNATGSKRNIRYPPYAFTEHGAIMAATVLNSPEAAPMSVFVVKLMAPPPETPKTAIGFTVRERLARYRTRRRK